VVAIVVAASLIVCAVRTAGAQSQEQSQEQSQAEAAAAFDTPFWTKRKVAVVTGFGGSIAAGVLAWSKEMDLRERKREMQGLPPGSLDEWNRQLSDATSVASARNVWGIVAISTATVTTIYALASRSREAREPGPGPGGRTPVKPIWDLRVNPFQRSVSIDWSF
jgi:hypothetical protein